ncbi:sulfotransferase family protein [Halorhodospira neutriphila]|uniref:Sulfotransferase domain-containing protein n=1 Tax=Halorhodospira neutriphila TaxID=168379 RepID=A0ABS1E2B6_9GAMM|nr:sulfotransferase [Halorhodospira neutriphila]MBK1725925.1 hypothetical protein [Halorhodospira neutriphila]
MKSKQAPNFFIPGAPKCGTTSLADWLASHPNIYMSPLKEPNYFSSDLHPPHKRSKPQYFRLFKGCSEAHQAIGEASVWYLYSDVAVPRIEKEIPGSRYIVCIRNPAEMAYSLHRELLGGAENIADFERAWRAQRERAQGQQIHARCDKPSFLLYSQSCALGTQLQKLLKRVPQERVLIVFLEDMKDNPREQYKRALDFLGVPDDGRTFFPVSNPRSEKRWYWMAALVSHLIKLRRRLFPYLGTGIIRSLRELNSSSKNSTEITSAMYTELIDYFLEEIQIIERITQRDLSHWR